MLFLTLFIACTTSEPAERPLIWQGQVYDDIPVDGVGGLVVGELEVRDMNGDPIAIGTQPDPESPSTWQIPLSGDAEEVEIRIAGSEPFTTVWRTTLPSQRSFWFSGTFFAVKETTLAPVWDALAEMTGEPLSTADGASLYGEPLALSDDDIEAWTDASVVVYDADGGVHPALTLSTTEDGLLTLSDETTGPISAFTVTGLPPGPLRLVIDASDGRHVVTDYNAEAGELLSAFAFTLPERR